MSLVNTGSNREPVDLSHFSFTNGKIGQLFALDVQPVIAGDSFETHIVGSIKMSPLFRELTLDPRLDLFAFYVPHRYVYGDEQWSEFMKEGYGTPTAQNTLTGSYSIPLGRFKALGLSGTSSDNSKTRSIPYWRCKPYLDIYNNFFKRPSDPDTSYSWLESPIDDPALRVCHLKTIWSADLPPENIDNAYVNTNGGPQADQVSLQALVEQAGIFSVDQERAFFQQRYRDVLDAFGGKASPDVDRRPSLITRSTSYASGYDVDGTGDTSLGSYVGRVTQPIDFKVPRFFCAEHGSIWIMGCLRYDPILNGENNMLDLNPNPTYSEFACDPSIDRNISGVRKYPFSEFFQSDDTTSQQLNVAHGQWHKYRSSFVSPVYSELPGYPFLGNIPFIERDRYYVKPSDYDDLFETMPMEHWKITSRVNTSVMRSTPSTADTILTSK